LRVRGEMASKCQDKQQASLSRWGFGPARLLGAPASSSRDDAELLASPSRRSRELQASSPFRHTLDEALEQTPKRRRKGIEAAGGANVHKDTCAICLDEVPRANAAFAPCGHGFCAECIRRWARERAEDPKCPLCKRSMCALRLPRSADGPSVLVLGEDGSDSDADPDQAETTVPWVRGARNIELVVMESNWPSAPLSRESRRLREEHTV